MRNEVADSVACNRSALNSGARSDNIFMPFLNTGRVGAFFVLVENVARYLQRYSSAITMAERRGWLR